MRRLLLAPRECVPDGGAMLVVTHGGVIHAIEVHLGLAAGRVDNLGGRWFHFDGDDPAPGEPVGL
ncbi:MAG: hypothetical protein LC118_00450 [Dehalococcoidia bacterium]|nr:hypothetical protein [Dehalococcoidia bacterium]